jgi:cell division protein FtsW (lipid II flippase)
MRTSVIHVAILAALLPLEEVGTVVLLVVVALVALAIAGLELRRLLG